MRVHILYFLLVTGLGSAIPMSKLISDSCKDHIDVVSSALVKKKNVTPSQGGTAGPPLSLTSIFSHFSGDSWKNSGRSGRRKNIGSIKNISKKSDDVESNPAGHESPPRNREQGERSENRNHLGQLLF